MLKQIQLENRLLLSQKVVWASKPQHLAEHRAAVKKQLFLRPKPAIPPLRNLKKLRQQAVSIIAALLSLSTSSEKSLFIFLQLVLWPLWAVFALLLSMWVTYAAPLVSAVKKVTLQLRYVYGRKKAKAVTQRKELAKKASLKAHVIVNFLETNLQPLIDAEESTHKNDIAFSRIPYWFETNNIQHMTHRVQSCLYLIDKYNSSYHAVLLTGIWWTHNVAAGCL